MAAVEGGTSNPGTTAGNYTVTGKSWRTAGPYSTTAATSAALDYPYALRMWWGFCRSCP